jgi:hypothetical protein
MSVDRQVTDDQPHAQVGVVSLSLGAFTLPAVRLIADSA